MGSSPISRYLAGVFSDALLSSNSESGFYYAIQMQFSRISALPAGFMFLVFLIWDYSLVPDLAEFYIPLRFVFFLICAISFFVLLHIKPGPLVGCLAVTIGISSVLITEYLINVYGLDKYSAVTGPVLIVFVAATLFLLKPFQILFLFLTTSIIRITNLWILDANFILYFTSGYYLLLSGFTAVTFSYLVSNLINEVYRSKKELADQNRRTESLILRILPEHVLEEFRNSDHRIADGRSEVTIMFADLVGFTELAKKVSPGHLVELLSELFGQFDEHAKAMKITRIKTIGDSYMAASGLTGEGIQEIIKMVNFATSARDAVRDFPEAHGIEIGVRIGIATGSAVTGVLSGEYLTFDVWGDTVNLASRLEASCPAGCIQISEATFWRVKSELLLGPLQNVKLRSIGERKSLVLEPDFKMPSEVLAKHGIC